MAKTKKTKHPKMDRLLISTEPYEINVAKKTLAKGNPSVEVTTNELLWAIEKFNHSRRKIYKWFREGKQDCP